MTGTGPIRILLADDQDSIRSAFRLILDAQPDMQVVAEAADGATALESARHLRPDVVLADIRMPRVNGLELTRRLAGPQVADPLRVIVVTTFDLDEYVHAALRDGASGFLLKRSGPALLIEAVRAAVAGDALVSPQITVRLLREFRRRAAIPAASVGGGHGDGTERGEPDARLTAREREIVRLVASGATNAEIAAALFLAPGTVKNHLAAVQRRLGVRNRVAVAAWAWKNGLGGADS